MSLELYDKAVFDKIKSLYDNTVFVHADRAAQQSSEDNNGLVKVPLISIWRLMEYSIQKSMINFRASRVGMTAKVDMNNNQATLARSIPVSLRYQVDIYSKQRNHVDELCAELILYLMQNPTISITIPKTNDILDFSLEIQDDIVDNTSISEFGDTGRIYRVTLDLVIDNARLFSFSENPLAIKVPISLFEM